MPKGSKKSSEYKYLSCTIKGCKSKIKYGTKFDGVLAVDSVLCINCTLGSTGICVKKYKAKELLPSISTFALQGKKFSRHTISKFDGTLMANGRSASQKKVA
jgi:hypothetical protein